MPHTIVSIYPKEIVEQIPTYNPSTFIIPAGPSVYVVPENVKTWRYVGEEKSITLPVEAKMLADEIVFSFGTTAEGVRQGLRPGILTVEGKYDTFEAFKKDKPHYVMGMELQQKEWFTDLVKTADDSWQVKRQHRLITNHQKLACKSLGLKREWAEITRPEDITACPACGRRRPAGSARRARARPPHPNG